jgi:hypothetical protein
MTLEKICEDEYGVSAYYITPVALIWAVEYLSRYESVDFAKKELERVNKIRIKKGVIPVYMN